MRRRLSAAAQDVLQPHCKILDVALDYQFGSSEAFGRAFRRMFGVLPSRMRLLGHLDPRRSLPRFTSSYLAAVAGLCLCPEKIHHPALELTGWMVPCEPGGTAFTSLWQRVTQRVTAELHHAGSKDPKRVLRAGISARYGILFYPHDWQAQGCFFFAGTTAEEAGDLAPLFVRAKVHAQVYACFTCACTEEDLHLILEHLFHTWLPHSGLHDLPDTALFEKRGSTAWLIYLPVSTQQ